jgi:LmbE family N-acetylglucosaminyl deacetylase
MKRALGSVVLLIAAGLVVRPSAAAEPSSAKPLRITVFGAHPDDAELKAGGTAAKWAKQGHQVKLVSVTNGDIGHWSMGRKELAARRLKEVQAADKLLGAACEVLDIHDGELEPTLENRRQITRLIRQWQADIVISHRPWDYHPDHRYVGVLVQDAAFMVTVPKFCPETPALTTNPVFLYSSDGFEKPNRFQPDICVALDDVIELKWDALHELESQTYEGGALGSAEQLANVPPASRPELRKAWFREQHRWAKIDSSIAEKFRDTLARCYGAEKAQQIRYAEAFEICEYGRRVTAEELQQLFPIGK